MKNLFSIFLLMTAYQAFAQSKPYKIVMFADGDAAVKANEFKAYLQTKPPFSKMGEKLTLEVIQLTPEELDCKNDNANSKRIISCNNTLVRKKQREADAHLSLVFTSKAKGGAGGDIPIASLSYPIQTMFHEMLHTYGFADEYDYNETEQLEYCKPARSAPNIAYFLDVPPYESDAAARTKHARQIPWMSGIPMVRMITHGSDLGSDSTIATTPGSQLLGVFKGGSCHSSTLPGWRPYDNSIMKGYADDTIYPLYEEVIVKNIEGSLGRSLQLPPPPENCFNDDYELNTIQHLHKHVEDAVKAVK